MKLINKIRSKVENKVMGAALRTKAAMEKVKNNDGEFFIDKGVAIIGILAVGVIVISLMLTAWKDTIMPNLSTKITEIFSLT